MNIINTIDDRKFSLNGIPYLRNYISAVYGQNVEIFNCYERCDVLVQRAPANQFRVNGVVYGSPATLQGALLDVIYSRNTMGGEIPDQDNIAIRKYFTYSPDYTTAQVLDKINSLPSYTVTEKQSVWFIGRSFELVESIPVPVINGPLNFPARDTPALSPSSLIKYKMMIKGKGVYGQGGTQLSMSNLELIYQAAPTENDIAEDPDTDIVNVGELGTQEIQEWLNSQPEPITVQPQNEGYTLFKGTKDGEAVSYLWIGEAGMYGTGETECEAGDFQLLEDALPVAGVQSVTGTNVDNTNPYHPRIREVKGLPRDFFVSCTIDSSLLNYKTDVYRTFDLESILPETEPVYITSQIVRLVDNDLFVVANSSYGYVLGITLHNCQITNNQLVIENAKCSRMTVETEDIDENRIHSAIFHNNFVFLSTRPDNLSVGQKILKINPYNLIDVKVLQLPTISPYTGQCTEIRGRGENIYFFLNSGSLTTTYFIRVSENLDTYEVLFSYGNDVTKKVRRDPPFLIYNDEIYLITVNTNSSAGNRYNTIGVTVFDFSGTVKREVNLIPFATGRTVYPTAHWLTINNYKLIISATNSTSGSGGGQQALIRFDAKSLAFEEHLELPNAITHRNSISKEGYLFLNEEESNHSGILPVRLLKINYKDFTDLTIEVQNYGVNGKGSYGSIDPLI